MGHRTPVQPLGRSARGDVARLSRLALSEETPDRGPSLHFLPSGPGKLPSGQGFLKGTRLPAHSSWHARCEMLQENRERPFFMITQPASVVATGHSDVL